MESPFVVFGANVLDDSEAHSKCFVVSLFSYYQLHFTPRNINSVETNALEEFLAKNRFSDYLQSFLECGYDDLFFIMNLDESDILEMLKDVGMTKVGHVKKFVAVWKAKKFSPVESHQESSKSQQETSATLPTRCKFHFIIAFLSLHALIWVVGHQLWLGTD